MAIDPEQSAEVEAVYDNWHAKKLAKITENFAAYIAALEGASVSEIIFSYEGEGDEGDVYDTSIVWAGEEPSDDLPTQLEEAIKEWALEVLGETYAGWQDGDGSRGEIHVEVATQQVTVCHEYRIWDYEKMDPRVVLTAAPPTPKETSSE
jgi:hypothetical protein